MDRIFTAPAPCETERNCFLGGEVAFETGSFLALDIELVAPYALEWKRGAAFERSWITPHSVCVLPPQDAVHLRWMAPIDFLTVRLSERWLAQTAEAWELRSPPQFAQLHGQIAPQIAHLCHAIDAEKRAGSPGGILLEQSLATALSASVLTRFAHAKAPVLNSHQTLGARRFARVCDFIQTHLDADLSLEELAQIAGLSAFHFARLFKAETGLTPHRYVTNARLECAMSLLQCGHAPAQVAARCGFCDQSHLARHLKARYGLTPRQIARDQRRA